MAVAARGTYRDDAAVGELAKVSAGCRTTHPALARERTGSEFLSRQHGQQHPAASTVRQEFPDAVFLLEGLGGSTPLAIIQHASTPRQRHAVTTLDHLAHTLVTEQLGSPSVIVVGDVLSGLAALQQPGSTQAGMRTGT